MVKTSSVFTSLFTSASSQNCTEDSCVYGSALIMIRQIHVDSYLFILVQDRELNRPLCCARVHLDMYYCLLTNTNVRCPFVSH